MRKFILITALVLASATAQAEGTRSLTLASNDAPTAVEQSKAADAPNYVERPAAVDTTSKPVADKGTPSTVKPKKRHLSTEARVISELHRHGIYW
jgi:hypothetical protein